MRTDPVYNSSRVSKKILRETGTSKAREQPLHRWTRGAGRDAGRSCSCLTPADTLAATTPPSNESKSGKRRSNYKLKYP